MRTRIEHDIATLPGMDFVNSKSQVKLTPKMLVGLTPEARRIVKGLLDPQNKLMKTREGRIKLLFDIAFNEVLWTSNQFSRLNTFIEVLTFLTGYRGQDGFPLIASGLGLHEEKWGAITCAYSYLKQAYNTRKQLQFAEVDDARNAEFYADAYRNSLWLAQKI